MTYLHFRIQQDITAIAPKINAANAHQEADLFNDDYEYYYCYYVELRVVDAGGRAHMDFAKHSRERKKEKNKNNVQLYVNFSMCNKKNLTFFYQKSQSLWEIAVC